MVNKFHKTLRSNERTSNNNFTLYLPKNVNINQIADLCRKIENELNNKQVPITNDTKKTLSFTDIELSKYISLRREKIFGVYIPANTKNPFLLLFCRLSATLSSTYRNLKFNLNAQMSSSPADIDKQPNSEAGERSEIESSNLYKHPKMINTNHPIHDSKINHEHAEQINHEHTEQINHEQSETYGMCPGL